MKKTLLFLIGAMLYSGVSLADNTIPDSALNDCENFRSSVANTGLKVRFGFIATNVLDATDRLSFGIDAAFHQSIQEKCFINVFDGTDPNFVLTVGQSKYPGLYESGFRFQTAPFSIYMNPKLSQVTIANILLKRGFDTFESRNGTTIMPVILRAKSLPNLSILWGEISKSGKVYQLVLTSISILNPY